MGYDMYLVKTDEEAKKKYEEAMAHVHELWTIRDAIPKEERGEYTEDEFKTSFAYGIPPANASERYREAQIASSKAYDTAQKLNTNYFRLNIWGMGHYCDVMLDLDICVNLVYRRPWPEYPWKDEENANEIIDAFYEWKDGEPADGELVERWNFIDCVHKLEAHKSWSPYPGVDDRIPIHKFGSNDGWIVTPAECKHAVMIARGSSESRVRDAFVRSYGEDMFSPKSLDVIELDNVMKYWHEWVEFIERAITHDGFEVH